VAFAFAKARLAFLQGLTLPLLGQKLLLLGLFLALNLITGLR
jgi:hypothetical protein